MTPHAEARLTLAEQISQSYASHSGVKTVFAFGSVGNRFADDYSDLELGVIWNHPPESEILKRMAADAGGKGWAYEGFHEPKLSYGDAFTKDDLVVECAHWTTAIMDEVIDAIMIHHDTSKNMLMYERQATAATLLRCIPFAGHDYLENLRAKLTPYPRALAIKILQENLSFRPLDEFQMMADRKEIPLFQEHLCGRIRKIHTLVFALNSLYHLSFKWTRFFLREAKILPANLETRIDNLFDPDLQKVVKDFHELVTELFDLIEHYFPEVDISEAVRSFREPAPKWQAIT